MLNKLEDRPKLDETAVPRRRHGKQRRAALPGTADERLRSVSAGDAAEVVLSRHTARVGSFFGATAALVPC